MHYISVYTSGSAFKGDTDLRGNLGLKFTSQPTEHPWTSKDPMTCSLFTRVYYYL